MSQNKNNILFFEILIAVFIIFAVLGSCSDNAEDMPETTTIAQSTTEAATETTVLTTAETVTFTATTEITTISQPVTEVNYTVYIGETGTKYHRQDCGTLKGNGIAITLDEALAQGRTPCRVCKP